MATLTDTAFYTRKAVKWGIVFLIGYTILRFLIGVGAGIWRQHRPEEAPEPTLTFGKLPPLKFPQNQDLPDLTFKLETIEGKLPTFTKVEKVYFIPKEIYSYLNRMFLTKTRDEWFDYLISKDVPVGKVLTMKEAFENPQVINREMVVEVESPTEGKVRQVGIPIKLSETPGRIRSTAPLFGQNTDEILKELGYTRQDIKELHLSGAVS